MMEGFGVHTFRLVNAKGSRPSSSFTGSRSSGCNRPSGTRLSSSRPPTTIFTGAICGSRFTPATSRSGNLGIQAFDERFADKLTLRRSRSDQDHSRGDLAGAARRPDGARSQSGQFLRRDRAGRLLPGEHRARHRFHQRSAAARPAVQLSRHAKVAAWHGELSINCRSTRRNVR